MNKRRIRIACCCALVLSFWGGLHAEEASKTTLVHYMPWYSSKPVSGQWGWHWTMNHFDPDKVDDSGWRQVASHYRPLIGPYDSNDPHTLECQVLLMKFAGIDGVVVDWYGIKDFRDYGVIHRNCEHFLRYVKKAQLKFAVCYEDQTVGHMIDGRVLRKTEDVAHGTEVLQWLGKNWFRDTAYLTVDGKPVMLVFGPQYFQAEQWTQMISGLPQRPLLYALPHLAQESGADGLFGWPPVHGGKKAIPAVWRRYLSDLYSRGANGESVIATVFPKFHDIYQEAGLHDSYGYLDDQGGKTFEQTLAIAWESDSRLIQIATWNDYGEGTVIEPTTSFGYRYLETLQQQRKLQPGNNFPFRSGDLRLPVLLYELRKRFADDEKATKQLDAASALLFSSKCSDARTVLAEM